MEMALLVLLLMGLVFLVFSAFGKLPLWPSVLCLFAMEAIRRFWR